MENYDNEIIRWYGREDFEDVKEELRKTSREGMIEDIDKKTGKLTEEHLASCSGCSLCDGDIKR